MDKTIRETYDAFIQREDCPNDLAFRNTLSRVCRGSSVFNELGKAIEESEPESAEETSLSEQRHLVFTAIEQIVENELNL